jgi:regulator of replication initiation timing
MEEQLYHQLGGVEHDLMMAQIRIEELQDVANHTKRHNDYLIMENEELRKDWEEALKNSSSKE